MLNKGSFKKSRNQLEGHSPQLTSTQPQVPATMCCRCEGCGMILYNAELQAHQAVCPQCGYHFRLSARQRLLLTCDANSFTELNAGITSHDPLHFPGYTGKLRNSRLKSGEKEAVITGTALINGYQAAVFCMDAAFMMGSLGSAAGEKITRLFEHAMQEKLPVIGFTVSGGARMQEGILSLMQMAKTSGAVAYHSRAGLLYITVLTNPTTGGVTASFAMQGDIQIAEPGALIGFAGPRVIEQTLRQKLPQGFQSAEFLLEKGFLDMIVPRTEMAATLAKLLALHGCKKQAKPVKPAEATPPASSPTCAPSTSIAQGRP